MVAFTVVLAWLKIFAHIGYPLDFTAPDFPWKEQNSVRFKKSNFNCLQIVAFFIRDQ